MKKISIYILSYLSALIMFSGFLWPVYAQEISPSEALPVPNQVIVQFEEGFAPFRLENEIKQSSNEKGVFRLISQFIESMIDKPSPHDTLVYIMNSEKTVGVTEKTRMFDAGDESQSNTYLYTIDGTHSVEQAINIFEKVPFIKYAQPNYLYITAQENTSL